MGVEGEIVIHKDLSIDEEARNNLSASWDNYLTTSLQNIADSNTDRTYGEDALIESVNNQLLPVKDRFHVYKIHTSFGRSASFTKESLEILLEESYAATMGGKVDIKVINGFDQAKNRFIGEGDHDSVTQLFTLQIKANGTGITKSVEIVIHKNIGLELCLPGELKALQTIEWTLYENPSFTREFVISAIKAKYWNMNKEKITVTVDDFESAFAAYRELEDGESMTCNIPVTVQKNNNSYSTSIPFKVTKDLSKCTGYNKGVCPNCGAMLGDVNEDGVIDENDALLMRQFLANIPSAMEAINMKLADINGDGTVNAKDQLQLRLMLAGNDIWA